MEKKGMKLEERKYLKQAAVALDEMLKYPFGLEADIRIKKKRYEPGEVETVIVKRRSRSKVDCDRPL